MCDTESFPEEVQKTRREKVQRNLEKAQKRQRPEHEQKREKLEKIFGLSEEHSTCTSTKCTVIDRRSERVSRRISGKWILTRLKDRKHHDYILANNYEQFRFSTQALVSVSVDNRTVKIDTSPVEIPDKIG